jgi:hypothetical protein
MLEDVEKAGWASIVSWLPDGKAFKVHQTDDFVKKIVPLYFKQRQFKSFQRQLHLYGFCRLSEGSYFHKFFIREDRHLSHQMTRRMTATAGSSSTDLVAATEITTTIKSVQLSHAKQTKPSSHSSKTGLFHQKRPSSRSSSSSPASTSSQGPTLETSLSAHHWNRKLLESTFDTTVDGRAASDDENDDDEPFQGLEPEEEDNDPIIKQLERSPSLERFETMLKELQSSNATTSMPENWMNPPRSTTAKRQKLFQTPTTAPVAGILFRPQAPPPPIDFTVSLDLSTSSVVAMSPTTYGRCYHNNNNYSHSVNTEMPGSLQPQPNTMASLQSLFSQQYQQQQPQQSPPPPQERSTVGSNSWLVNTTTTTNSGMLSQKQPDLAHLFPMNVNSMMMVSPPSFDLSSSSCAATAQATEAASSRSHCGSSSLLSSSSSSASTSMRSSLPSISQGKFGPSSSSALSSLAMLMSASPNCNTEDFLSLFRQQQHHPQQPPEESSSFSLPFSYKNGMNVSSSVVDHTDMTTVPSSFVEQHQHDQHEHPEPNTVIVSGFMPFHCPSSTRTNAMSNHLPRVMPSQSSSLLMSASNPPGSSSTGDDMMLWDDLFQ